MKWSEDDLKTALRLQAEGKSGREIANVIGTSKSSVIGKLRRAGGVFQSRVQPPPPPKPKLVPRRAVLREKVLSLFADPEGVIVSVGVPFERTRKGQCRWFLDDGQCCGNNSGTGSYCPGHMMVVYRPSSTRDRMLERAFA